MKTENEFLRLLAYYTEEYDLTPEEISILQGAKHTVKIPKNKIRAKFKWLVKKDKKTLKLIHPDVDTAIELCYLYLDNFKATHIIAEKATDYMTSLGYKIINAEESRKKMSQYKRVQDFLIKHNIIEKSDRGYVKGVRSTEFRLTEKYFFCGKETYTLETRYVRAKRTGTFNENMKRLFSSEIGRNSFRISHYLTFPSEEEVLAKLREVASVGTFRNKKGKLLIEIPKGHSKKEASYDPKKYCFVHEYLEIFKQVRDTIKTPIVKDGNSGGRVYDNFNMMPRVIRPLIKLNGRPIVECDYSCLHPNIATQAKYGGFNIEGITHDKVATELYGVKPADVDYKQKRSRVKKAHLSYFNMKWMDMVTNHKELHAYYMQKEPNMMHYLKLEKLREPKNKKDAPHKDTSKRLFTDETRLMTNVITELLGDGIEVAYCFDALYCNPEDEEIVREVMNAEASKMGIKTTA
jgi:hypothetical protein